MRDAAAMEITLEASVFPTEDAELVRRAMMNVFPDAVDADGKRFPDAVSADGKHFPDAVDADGKHFPDAVDADVKPFADAAPSLVVMTSRDTEKLARRIAEQMIRDTARSVLARSVKGGRIEFCLNKQAALANRVNFTDGNSLLGDIGVSIECDEPEAEIMRMTGGLL